MGPEINLIYGRNPVKEALKAKRVKSILLTDSMNDPVILEEIKLQRIEYKIVSSIELTNKTKVDKHQGVVAFVKPYEYIDLNEIIRRSKSVDVPIVLILDGINDPHNLGAILRSCDVFGVSGIIIGKHNQVPLNATVAKTSAGAIYNMPIILVSNLLNSLNKLKDMGYWIIGTDMNGEDYTKIDYNMPICLIIGNEGHGMSKILRDNVDFMAKIPMSGKINSLNASVSCGIILSRIVSGDR